MSRQFHKTLIGISAAASMLAWLGLAVAVGRIGGTDATFGHAVLVSFSALPAVAFIQLSIAYAQREDREVDPDAADAARRINVRLVGGGN